MSNRMSEKCRRTLRIAVLTCMVMLAASIPLLSQGLTTTDSPNDWEEVNFEFDSAILSDGYPSLLRLAELLKQNPSYRLELTGHTDSMGTVQYNNRLSQQRASTVKEFLVKYGANASQITTTGESKNEPKVANTTAEGRFINRRVVLTLRDGNGNVVAAGGVGDSISALQELLRKQEECCSEILKRLDKLDDILAAINGLKNENDKLRSELDRVKSSQDEMARRLGTEPGSGAGAGMGATPVAQDIARATKELMDQDTNRDRATYGGHDSNKFTLMGLNFGPRTPDGNLTFTGRARYFNAFSKNFALQSEGEFMYWKDRQEGQFDLGLVGRGGPMQLGLFSSFRHVNFREFNAGATLGQASATVDYVFNRGRVGAYGTKGFLTDSLVSSQLFSPTRVFRVDTYAAVVDQLGFSGQVGLWGDAYVEGNAGALFRRFGDNKFGGMGRFVQPVSKRVAVSVEAGMNETLVGNSNYGRLAVGLLFGSWLRPKDYATADGPVPVDIPRVRYELVQTTTRTGNTPPVADAGGDRLGVEAGEFVLDGSASYDPDGDTITYQWDQISGPTVSLGGRSTSRALFTALENETYVFRLTVRDTEGATGVARSTVSTQQLGGTPPNGGGLRIARFEASPMTLSPGESTTLSWIAEGADSVTITNVGTVEAAGSRSVTPLQSTTYVLTATKGTASVQGSVTVTVGSAAAPRIVRFSASNPQIASGGQSALIWEVENATEVSISSLGVVDQTGTTTVSPSETTTYVLTARNANGQSTAQTVVSVSSPVKILDFRATPAAIATANSPITLSWQTEGAQEVVITGIGPVANSGSIQVSPASSTSYNLIAYGPVNNASAVVKVQVGGTDGGIPVGLRITRFEVSPVSISAGETSTLTWATEGADSITISGLGTVEPSGSRTVTPAQTTTYTLNAVRGSASLQSSATVTVGTAALPRIVRFTSSNPQIIPGGQSTLLWEVENATEVTISTLGTVQNSGSSEVSPTVSTTYVLTARNATGESTAQTVVTVSGPVRIVDFRATPSTVTQPNSPITLSWETEGAQEVVITGIGPVATSGTLQVALSAGASYTLIAYGPANSVSAVVVVQGSGAGGGGAGGNRPPVANAGADRTLNQFSFNLDGSASFDPDGDPIQYSWRLISNRPATIVNPESATPTINAFLGGPGSYVFELTVTDSFGAFSTDTVRITISE